MEKRTYKEAVEITVKWWAEKSFLTPFNQNNGDYSDSGTIGLFLVNMSSAVAQKKVTPEKLQNFKSKLTELLLENEGKGRYATQLDVDYYPNKMLTEACRFAEVDTDCLPIKTFTFINEENQVEGRFQYGGKWFKL
jgi:hypothetical protein